MGFDQVSREQLVAWAQENQPKAAEARKRKGLERAEYICKLLNRGLDAREISFRLDMSMSATYTAIHRARKRVSDAEAQELS